MNDTEKLLRDVMVDWASGVSARSDLADAVLARDRRKRRRKVLVSAFAAVVLLASAGVLWAIAPWRVDNEATDRLVPASPPRPADSAPPSPVDFGWLPTGYDNLEAALVASDSWRLTASNKSAPTEIELTVSSTKIPEIRGTGETGTVEVNGVTATTYSVPPHPVGAAPYGTVPPDADGATESITFERKSGQWIRVYAHLAGGTKSLGLTRDDLLRIADNLVDRERRVPDLLDVADADGLQMAFSRYSEWFGATIGFVLTSGPPAEEQWRVDDSGQKSLTPIMIYLGSPDAVEGFSGYAPRDPVLQTVRVEDRTIIRKESGQRLWKSAVVRYADGQIAVVLVPKTMSDAELMTFASGITPGADFKPAHR
ncbi:hypothetical protein [Cryptosporangium minutisporangium]|uniref:DUF4367 domain-containing protein n=1 Tax=Cryptosporangium minutisporangium TaxID=113569 RepID=A0ABP6T3K5_9ACTN